MGQSVATKTWQSGGRNCSKENFERSSPKAQAQQLGPTGLENLGKVIKKMKQKAPGPDGWTCQFLKDLDEAGVQGLKEQMIEWKDKAGCQDSCASHLSQCWRKMTKLKDQLV